MTTLIAVPSKEELDILLEERPIPKTDNGLTIYHAHDADWVLCGIGPAATAFSLTHHLLKRNPTRVIMLGIAGAFEQSQLAPGDLVQVGHETFADLGYTEPNHLVNLDQMGLTMLADEAHPLGCKYQLEPLNRGLASHTSITVSSITNTRERAQSLRNSFRADIENMEGAAAAMVCSFYRTPFHQLRAISNIVGPRDSNRWTVAEPLRKLKDWALTLLAQGCSHS